MTAAPARSSPVLPRCSPLHYVQLISAAVLGYLLFGDVPSAWTWAGAALIVASGVTSAWWESFGQPPGGLGTLRGPM
jgi:drug/metabolite transporter (DMT)-like permease